MFDCVYKFNLVGVDKALNKKYLVKVITYSFHSENNYYLVEVEVYKYHIYIIKFYLKKNKNNPLKYNLLTNEHKCSRVIGTCLRILIDIHQSDPLGSFGFLGAHTVDLEKNITESKGMTKRFRSYRKAVLYNFGEQTFTHFQNAVNSTYLAVSNKNESVEYIKEQADKMFFDLFPELG